MGDTTFPCLRFRCDKVFAVLEAMVDFLVAWGPREAIRPRISKRQPRKKRWIKSIYRTTYVYYGLDVHNVSTAGFDSSRA